MTVIRVHELAKKMGVESKELVAVLEKMGIKGKTPTSGLDDKETKSLIEKLKAVRKEKEKEKTKKEKDTVDVIASKEERLKKAAALIGKFSSTIEKPGVKPKPAPIPPQPKPEMPAPPVIPPPGQVKQSPPAKAEEKKAAPDIQSVKAQPAQVAQIQQPTQAPRPVPSPAVRSVQQVPQRPVGAGPRPARQFGRPTFGAPVLEPSQVPPSLIPAKPSKKKWQKKSEYGPKDDREFREKPSFKKLPDLKTLPSGRKPHKKDERYAPQTDVAEITKPRRKMVKIQEGCTIKEFSEVMGQKVGDVIKKLMTMGIMATQNQTMDTDAAMLLADEYGIKAEMASIESAEDILEEKADEAEAMMMRPPVVTIMGHVDHGKTSLLDAVRETNVVSREAGGITQHIGAYQVGLKGRDITFLDTPGHAAFTAMRARGAQVTDIVILVVAADDGVMPQTREAINHAKAAGVPIIVAINKIDKPDAKPERVRTELLQHEVQVESFGGDVVDVEVSAKNKTNLDKLLEMIALQAEILDLKTNSQSPAEGTVIEAKLDRGRVPGATVLVQRGTLRIGDIIVAGAEMGRVRALISAQGENLTEAGPSVPVEVLGFHGPPEAGDRLAVVENEARARQITSYRAHQKRENAAASISGMRGSLEQMMSQLKTAGRKEFPLIIKADVQGSLEAILGSLEKLGTDEVAARILHAGVGGISESDVTLAEGFNAAIIGFSVRANKEAAAAAKRNGIEIRYYNIIYDLVDDVKKAMSGLLAPTLRETMLGNAEILEIFNISKVGKVAGCRVTDGTVERGANVRLIRDNVVVHEGKLSTLKRFKDEVKEVGAGQECGMAFENYQDMRVGDVIECYRVETIQRSL